MSSLICSLCDATFCCFALWSAQPQPVRWKQALNPVDILPFEDSLPALYRPVEVVGGAASPFVGLRRCMLVGPPCYLDASPTLHKSWSQGGVTPNGVWFPIGTYADWAKGFIPVRG
jgi:hypothetical protein